MMVTVNDMLTTIFLCLFLFCFPLLCSAGDIITWNSSITDIQRETLVSAGGRFELGFFTPNGDSSSRRYVGIWYYRSSPRTVVWVANRDKPLGNSDGVVAIAEDGNAKVLDRNNKSYWSTDRGRNSSYTNRILKLQDPGNLVLTDPSNNTVIWQSFDNPTDTFLLGMKMDANMVLTSWKSSDDPGLGHFTFQQDQDVPNQYIIRKEESTIYWQSRVSGDFIYSSDYEILPAIFSEIGRFQRRIRGNCNGGSQETEACGNFGSCNSRTRKLCKCLPGFEPNSPNKWNSGDFSDGCKRVSISTICDENGRRDSFLSLKMMKVGKATDLFHVRNETDCANDCLRDCSCQAYSYDENVQWRFDKQGKCRIWGDLDNLSDNFTSGRELSVRVPASDIVSSGSCNESSNSTSDPVFEDILIKEIEISWDPPLEPICSSTKDYTDWEHMTCNVWEDGHSKCHCNGPYRWDLVNVNCTSVFGPFGPGEGPSQEKDKKPSYLISWGLLQL
ncbi:hypothetical protein FH972_014490 [Carpinus fangiana]|uniref:Bulb-type lectin domain-containing protein n=1 Tax=Carpinus fangiana TaxID=176857 RepID=A0A5N6RA54_9ROSI|nr:hypothetical protein FH972_014490 [Carpinus fangiana]